MQTTMIAWTPDAIPHVIASMETASDRYEAFALRVMSVHREIVTAPAVGDILPASSVWDDGEPTDDTLDGTCGIEIGEWDYDRQVTTADTDDVLWGARMAASYFGRYVVLMAGHSAGVGADQGETIIRDAEVIAVYDRGTETCDWDVWGGIRACKAA